MGPYGTNLSVERMIEAEREKDERLTAARDTFPYLRIIEVRGGYAAVHSDAVYLDAANLDELVRQLREQ